MSDMRYVLPGADTITLSGQTADKLLRAGDGQAALLYLYVLRSGGTLSTREASGALGMSESQVTAAMTLLGRLGLLRCDTSQPVERPVEKPVATEELPQYSIDDIRQELSQGAVFSSLVQEVQRSLGKILTSDDLLKLFGIYDSLGLPPEVILQLITHCIDENQRRYGPGRVPTLRYVEKTAYTWEREGILSLEEAERYLKQLEVRRGHAADMKRVLQIKDRALTAGERKYVDGWLALGFSAEVIELAYDKTVLKTGRLAWNYMDSILKSWHQKGLRTIDEIEKKDGRSTAAPSKGPQKPEKTAEADLAEYQRMEKILRKMRGE